ncbi:hypothetical protein NL676_005813 [Syzygium grande]|nr:hypothetical protein NL676_005813 [Syzygium grande]
MANLRGEGKLTYVLDSLSSRKVGDPGEKVAAEAPITPPATPLTAVLHPPVRHIRALARASYRPKQPGIAIGRLCEKCDGKCVVCDSYVRPCTLVRVCDECNYGSFQGRCVICGGVGISDAYYCKECTQQEKDRDGCPKIVNLGSAKTDLFYERKKYGFKKR